MSSKMDFIKKVSELIGITVLDHETKFKRTYIYVDKETMWAIQRNSLKIEKELGVKDLEFTVGKAFKDREGNIYEFEVK